MPSDPHAALARLGKFSTIAQLRDAVERHSGHRLHVHHSGTLVGEYCSALVVTAHDGHHVIVPIRDGTDPVVLELRALAHIIFGHKTQTRSTRLISPYSPQQVNQADGLATLFLERLDQSPER